MSIMQLASHRGAQTACFSGRQHVVATTALQPVQTREACSLVALQAQGGSRRARVVCLARQKIDAKEALQGLRSGMAGGVDPAYVAGANYLRSIGFTNAADIARVLDVAMNPNSLFVSYTGRRSRNTLARLLDVDQDMAPVVGFLTSQNVKPQDIIAIISAHPAVLCYSVPDRLAPFFEYLTSIGVTDVAAAVIKRPSLLGLEADANLRKIVDYLAYVDTPPEMIVKYITTSI